MSRLLWVPALACLTIVPCLAAKKSVVLFPFGLGSEVMETKDYKLQDELTKAFKASLDKNADLQISVFSRMHPSIKRALAEGSLKSSLLLEPFTGQADGQFKAITLGKLLRGNFAVAGLVEDFSYDVQKKTAKLVASLDVFDLKTSKMMGSVVLTSVGAGETEMDAAKSAVAKYTEIAVPQLVTVLNKPPKKDKQ